MPLTLATIIINALCVNQIIGTWKQSALVWRNRSIEGVSITTMTYYGFYFLAFLFYGIDRGSLNMAIGGFQFLLYVPIILGAWKFGNANDRKLVLVRSLQCALIPIIMIIVPWKNAYLLLLLFLILWTMVLMYRELRDAHGVGSFEASFAWAFLLAAIFWFAYAIILRDVALMIFNPLAGLILIATLHLYYKKKRDEATST